MQRLVFVLGLTACYQPGGAEAPCTIVCGAASACPGDLVCNRAMNLCALANGGCTVDGGIDGTGNPDATMPGGLCAVPPMNVIPKTLTSGRWYVVDPASGRGVKARGQAMLGTTNPHTTLDADFVDLGFAQVTNTSLIAPRLAHGGDELYLTKQITDGATTIVASKRNPGGNTWSEPEFQLLIDESSAPVALSGDEAASPPTTTAPRRMLVSSTSVGGLLDEYVEAGPGQWQRLRSHPTQFTGVEYFGQASLSQEGRRLVFLGRIPGGVPQGFYVERSSVTVEFPQMATAIPVGYTDGVTTPYLTSDCQHYYFTGASEQIFHVAYP